MTFKNWILSAILFGTALIVQADPTVGFSSKNIKAATGEAFEVDIVMSGFENTEGGGFNLNFDPNVVEVKGVVLNADVWDFVNKEGAISNDTGVVSDILFSSYKGTGDATIATVSFRALKKGHSKLKMTESIVTPFGDNGKALSVVFNKASIHVK